MAHFEKCFEGILADGGRTEPLAVIYRKKKQLTPAMTHFINALKQPVPAAN